MFIEAFTQHTGESLFHYRQQLQELCQMLTFSKISELCKHNPQSCVAIVKGHVTEEEITISNMKIVELLLVEKKPVENL